MASLSAIKSVLSQRNTRIFYGCSAFSWTGLWVQQIATDWLAWELTHSPLWVGILAFCNLGPSVIVSPFAGAFSDRLDRLRLTVATQLVTAAHSATLVVLTATGVIRIEHMVVLQIILGISQSFAQPARQSLVPGMVSRADLPGAVALNSLTYNIARSVGPGIGGVLVAAWGVIPGMVVNCVAYLIASVTMPMLRLSPETRRGHPPPAAAWCARRWTASPMWRGTRAWRRCSSMPGSSASGPQRARDAGPPTSPGCGDAGRGAGDARHDHGPRGARRRAVHRHARPAPRPLQADARRRAGDVGRHRAVRGHHTPSISPWSALALGAAGTIHGISAQTLLQSGTSGHMLAGC